MNTMLTELVYGSVYSSFGSLRGASQAAGVRMIAHVDAPSTGAVRPQADQSRTRLVDSPKGGVSVRTWSPPV